MSAAIRLEHVGIPASEDDFDEVVDFYSSVFGWQVMREMDGPPRINFITDGDGGILEVYTSDGPALTHPAHLAFAVPVSEFADLRSRLEATGVKLQWEQQNQAGDSLAFYLDPHGNCFQIVGRINPLT